MGEKPAGGEEPTLELPKLFGRRKKKDQPAPASTEQHPPEEEAPEEPVPAPVEQPPPVDEPPEEPVPAPVEQPPPVDEPPEEPVPAPIPDDRRARRDRRARQARPARTRSRPRVPGTLAAALTGLLVGAAGCGLTFAALAGCEAVRGTDSCGGPGLFLLIAILALMVLLGAGLLALMGAASAGSTSFLAVGLVAVLVMVALLDVVFSPWMFLVVPLMGAASYVLSHWVTTRFADEAADPAVFEDEPGPDIR